MFTQLEEWFFERIQEAIDKVVKRHLDAARNKRVPLIRKNALWDEMGLDSRSLDRLEKAGLKRYKAGGSAVWYDIDEIVRVMGELGEK
ncbi:MAG: hypothetical protein FWF59_00275 [Turicibacter sp.]|nr:hypothetical protein [Turicibacter sp.]